MKNYNTNELNKQLEQQLDQQAKERYLTIGTLMCLIRKHTNHPFKTIDKRLYPSIITTTVVLENPLNVLLKYTAYGQSDEVKAILEKNPRFLLERGNVIDPAGNVIKGVSAYECALGAGDDEMGSMIRGYFDKFAGGDGALKEQEEHYKNAIINMLNQKIYDFEPLIKAMKTASLEELQEAFDLNLNYQSPLQDELKKFRKSFEPRVIKNGEMHFNYANFLKTYALLCEEYENCGNGFHPIFHGIFFDMFFNQIIGYLQRGLPACERQAFKQGLFDIVDSHEKLKRTFQGRFFNDESDFPITAYDRTHTGLGFKYHFNGYCASIYGLIRALQKLYETKASSLQNLCHHTKKRKFST